MEYGQSGTIYDRKKAILALLSKSDRNVEIKDFTIRCLSRNVAEAHYIAVQKGEEAHRSLRTSIWIMVDGRWRLRFHQGTQNHGIIGKAGPMRTGSTDIKR